MGPFEAPNVRRLGGQCLCGSVRYVVDDAFEYALNCHCGNCRRATGSAFKAFAGIARDRLTLTHGQGELLIHGAPEAGDIRCRACGSLLYSVVRDAAYVHVTLGTLTDPPSIRPGAHIFTASKASWFDITDDLPRFAGHVVAEDDLPAAPAAA